MARAAETTTKTSAKKASAKKAGAKAGAGKSTKRGTVTKADQAEQATPQTRSGSPAAKAAPAAQQSRSGSQASPKKPTRSAAETERIRAALAARLDELKEEYEAHLAEIAELQRDRFTDVAGDDQADTGSKTFEREQEISLAHSILERSNQVERALERLDEGNYGWCERCGSPIPVERLAAFPSATLCVACKQLEERR